ncbi:hypothetical protein [Halomonas aquatica]|uniref:protein-tyrosine-phosphatase n=1 Tax=Halomonas aquatica TaxID=3151123 RepID=A0ABV1NFY7_9GAMM
MFQHILVVCNGNICRSPVATAMLAAALPGKHFTSAGLGALAGHGVEPTARELAEADGLLLDHHQARQLTSEMLADADLILRPATGPQVVDHRHQGALRRDRRRLCAAGHSDLPR